MHTQFDLAAVLCLLGICLGALVYGLADLSFSISGYVWLTMNVIAISWYQVMMKNIASQKLLNTLGMTLYNNVLSVPLFMLQTIINKEDLRDASLSSSALGILVASAVCGTILSITAVAMNQYMTATSLMVLNHVNKFCLILLEHFLIEPTLTWISFAGTLQVIMFGFLYGESRMSSRILPVMYAELTTYLLFGSTLSFLAYNVIKV
mmetsp:Transcript_26223/g.86240  ORF Transcript_26223/g.86240 Transcript_26223/m.86240 type:complete len:207 (-) Transcript_26223:87-707(-)